MLQKEELSNFDKMCVWLHEHPALDQKYYMENVAKLEGNWVNNCPLCNNAFMEHCDGCTMLWGSSGGSLCTDSESPLSKWIKMTGKGDADKRSYYAGELTLLVERRISDMGQETRRCHSSAHSCIKKVYHLLDLK